ncbi:MAG TPA: CRISPR-associated protein Cas4 [Pyrinomonadaceae bacterium]|nr:CRISPR-associated protein Cas4 [Pyrinomonadaceae bacterium]
MSYLFIALGVLLLVALVARAAAGRARQASGLPAGRLVYSDTGYAVGRVAPTERNLEGVRQERPLVSRRYGLTGRPDYLVRTDEGIIPVEAKSTRLPAGGRPYDSHVMQLAAYCLLAEDALGATVPYGVIRYSDGEVTVDYTTELRDELLALLEEMREARAAVDVHRSHADARRCKGCSVREHCVESLA